MARKEKIQRYSRRRHGLTQLEVVIASLLVGLVLVAAMRALPGVLQTRTTAAQLRDGNHLAEQLLTEIIQSPYEDPEEPGSPLGLDTAEGSSNRADWDDVDDYHTYSQSPPQDKAGNDITEYTGWTREVTVEYLDPADPQTTIVTDQGLKRILVRATSPVGKQSELWAMRSTEGTLEQSLGAGDTTFVSWLGCRLQVSADNDPVIGGTNLVNHAEDE
jgi:hypothetical protein